MARSTVILSAVPLDCLSRIGIGGAAGLAGVEQERPSFQLLQRLGPARDGLGVDGVVGIEPEVTGGPP